jgi:hypothetical protein
MPPSRSETARVVDQHWLDLFEDRYGAGAYARVLEQLRTPCVSFADIAQHFGVTRERVRQWHLQLMPGAPRGHQRRRLCLREEWKRTLLTDPVFRAFYRRARQHFAAGEVVPIAGRRGYRRRAIRLAGQLVTLKTARVVGDTPAEAVPSHPATSYVLTPGRRGAEFIYYHLTPDSFLFLPADLLPRSSTTFVERTDSKYWRYRNSFVAAQRRLALERHAS